MPMAQALETAAESDIHRVISEPVPLKEITRVISTFETPCAIILISLVPEDERQIPM